MARKAIAVDHSITMWGPPATGKTTFLAALSIALLQRGSAWRVRGMDQHSTDRLIELTRGLTRERAFPRGTVGIAHYRWALHGRLMRRVKGRWPWPRRREVDITIRLDLVDSQGELAHMKRRGAQADLISNLMNSSAIIFLYDPIREAINDGEAFDHTFGVLQQMAQLAADFPEGKLPHYVAVCVTKFDEMKVFKTAEELDLLVYDLDPPEFPRVDACDARELFGALLKVQPDGDAGLVLNLLEQNFRPERIKYFITSAIGFYVDARTGKFNPKNYQNHLYDPDNPRQSRIRGAIHPINVVEPLLWITDVLTEETEAVTGT